MGEPERSFPTPREWEVDLGARELRAHGVPVRIGSRAFEIIEALVKAAGELVTKDEIMRRVWPGTTVEDNTVQVHIAAIRKALGADRKMLKTVSGRGYRLLGDWTMREKSASASPPIASTPTVLSIQPFQTNFPAASSELVGRVAAVQQVQDLLSAYRTVTLTGPGGIGKTALALETARALFPSFQGDGWFVDLVSLSDPDLVPSTVASSLGLKLGGETSAEAVARGVAGKKLLLVLDNCEHVVDAAAQLAETLMRLCPRTTVLATSRELLRIEGEHVYRVPPLNVPPEGQDNADDVLSHSAVQFFVARTTALHAASSPELDNLSAIAAVCRQLDGIPLAIEFAAARAATLGIQQVTEHLDDRFGFLTGGHRTALPRQQTLRATLDWSYELLSEAERRLLRHLAVFAGGFTLEAAAAVMSSDFTSIAEGVSNLVSKSLVTPDPTASAGRCRLLETIRVYALEKLAEHDEAQQAARRHAEYFRDLIAPSTLGLPLQPIAEDTVKHGHEIGNIRAALDWSFSRSGDAAIGIALTAIYVPVWSYLGLRSECCERTEHALDRLGPERNLDLSLSIHLHLALGLTLLFTMRSTQRAREALGNALTGATELDDVKVQVLAQWGLWILYFNTGECRDAHSTALAFARTADRTADQGLILMGDRLIGSTLHFSSRQRDARRYFEHQIEHYVAPRDPRYTVWLYYDQAALTQAMLARVLVLEGFADKAVAHARASLVAAEAINSQSTIVEVCRLAMVPVMLMIGNLDAAEHALQTLVDLAASLNAPFWVNAAHSLSARLRIERGDFEIGTKQLRAALDAGNKTGWTIWYPEFLGAMAMGLAGLGRTAEAIVAVSEGLAKAERGGETYYIPELLRIEGEIHLRNGALAAAEDSFQRAVEIAQQHGALFWELRAAISLAGLRIKQGRASEARQVIMPAYVRFTEGFDTVDLRAAREMLEGL